MKGIHVTHTAGIWGFGIACILVSIAVVVRVGMRKHFADLPAAVSWVRARHPEVACLTSAQVAHQTSEKQLIVDVRSEREWRISHLPQAWRSEDPDQVVAEARRLQATRLIVYCSIGERSSRLAEKVKILDPALPVFDLAGGIFTWATENRPLVDADQNPTRLVHPYDSTWGTLLPADRVAPVTGLHP